MGWVIALGFALVLLGAWLMLSRPYGVDACDWWHG